MTIKIINYFYFLLDLNIVLPIFIYIDEFFSMLWSRTPHASFVFTGGEQKDAKGANRIYSNIKASPSRRHSTVIGSVKMLANILSIN